MHLQTTANYPSVRDKLTQYYERIDGFETTYTNLILDVAHKKYIAKNILIQAEDARLYNEFRHPFHCNLYQWRRRHSCNLFHFRKDLIRIYTNLNKLNEDLAGSYQIRKQNFIEMQKSLDAVNSVLKSSIRLRGE